MSLRGAILTGVAVALATVGMLRPYQADLKSNVYAQWSAGNRNVLAVLPTGGGKTVVFADILREYPGASVAIAHRRELVQQISLALAREKVRHRIIGPESVRRACMAAHMREFKVHYIDARARVAVAGVDTLVGMDPAQDPWFAQVGLWVQDEAHHVLRGNKWGTAAAMFPNAYGLGVTATPCRADGKGLGRHAHGLFDALVLGPTMRELIAAGYLTEYRIFAPPCHVDLSNVPVGESGEYSPKPLAAAVHASPIVGDVVEHYLRIAPGKLGVTFAVDVESATEIAAAFRAAGVPAEVVSAKTPDALRTQILRRFAAREILQLVNVDLFGEGFDLPAIEVVSMARPTQSFSLFCQQFGRSLRLLDGKGRAIIIDHVNNTLRHGLPDAPRFWTLDARPKRGSGRGVADDVIPVRACLNPECLGVYERVYQACPYCGTVPVPAVRSAPEHVDGVLHELDAETLRVMRGEIGKVDGPARFPANAAPEVVGSIQRRHNERQVAQTALRESVAAWGGVQAANGRETAEAQARFFYRFGVDVGTAQTLGAREADELRRRVVDDLVNSGYAAA